MHIRGQVVLKRWAHPDPDSLRGEDGRWGGGGGDKLMETGTSEGRHGSPDGPGVGGERAPGLGPERSTCPAETSPAPERHLQQLTATPEETEVREAGGPLSPDPSGCNRTRFTSKYRELGIYFICFLFFSFHKKVKTVEFSWNYCVNRDASPLTGPFLQLVEKNE